MNFLGGMMTAFTLTSDLYQVSRDKERDTGVFVTRMVVDYCKEHPNDYLATVAQDAISALAEKEGLWKQNNTKESSNSQSSNSPRITY
jgi:hypothetical protein